VRVWGRALARYSTAQLSALTEHILKTAVTSYRHLVETCFPAFGTSLGLYSIMPVMIEGIVKTDEDPGWETSLTCIFRQAPGPRSSDEPPEVRVALRPADLITGLEDNITMPDDTGRRGSGPANPALSLRFCDPFGPNLARPATCLAYTWLAEDLAGLGWADSRRGCSV